jgi:hypothetical protein
MMQGASFDGSHPGLHSKQLDAAIERVPVPYRPGGRHGDEFVETKQNTNKKLFLAN